MKKIFNKFYSFYLLLCLIPYRLLAAGGDSGNIAQKLASGVNEQINSVGGSIASIVKTGATVFGIVWVAVTLFMAFFAMEQLKQNAKLLVASLVIIGLVYGLASSLAA